MAQIKNRRIREGKYLYEELLDIQNKVNQSNVSLINELREFAQRSGVREFVRLTAIISDTGTREAHWRKNWKQKVFCYGQPEKARGGEWTAC